MLFRCGRKAKTEIISQKQKRISVDKALEMPASNLSENWRNASIRVIRVNFVKFIFLIRFSLMYGLL